MNRIKSKLQIVTVSVRHTVTKHLKQKALGSYRVLITILELIIIIFEMSRGRLDTTNLELYTNANNILKSAANKFGRSVTADLIH